jgi:sn1-specific diacylglycerol lipase
MPAIHLFHRRTLLGGDDLHLPVIFTLILRFVQLLGLILPVWMHIGWEAHHHGGLWNYIWFTHEEGCQYAHFMPLFLFIYALTSTIMTALSLVWEVRLYHASALGCPTETQPRSQKVETLLEFKLLPLGILQILVLLLGVVVVCLARSYYNCHYETSTISSNHQQDDFWSFVTSTFDDDIVQSSRATDQPPLLWWIPFAFLWITQAVEVLAVVLFWRQLFGRPPTTTQTELHHELVEQMWTERCTSFCECLGMSTCFLFGGRNMAQGDYGAVAMALTDYFEAGNAVLDLVPSDIVMGFFILQKIQRQRILKSREEVLRETEQLMTGESSLLQTSSVEDHSSSILAPPSSADHKRQSFYRVHHEEGQETFYESTSRKVLNLNKAMDRATLQEGARFARYQLAIYTWLMYVYMNPVSGLPRLLRKKYQQHGCSCCCSSPPREGEDDAELLMGNDVPSGVVIGDNSCKVHRTALLLQAGIDDESVELIYAQLNSSFSEIPYCIIVDHAWKSVVLAIRGTFSLEDCVKDVLIHPESLEEVGDEFGFDGRDQYCHGGVLSCTRIVYRDLQRHRILDKLLLGDTAKYADYTLRVVGHSLGAATSTLISYMLRQRFPTLRCLNYSPPGCSFTRRLATDCQDWCTAFVLDSDLVPRLSLQTLEHLRDEVLKLIGRVKVPKAEVAQRTLPSAGFSCQRGSSRNQDIFALEELIQDILLDEDEIPSDSQYFQRFREFKAIQEERKSSRGPSRNIQMYPPGRIVHFLKTGEQRSCRSGIVKCLTCCTTNIGAEYTPIWVNNDDFDDIIVSPTMGTDHFPDRLTTVMQDLTREYALDTNRWCSFEPTSNIGLQL